jgi:glucose/mannose-6-phosphate isomerase
MEKLIHAFPQNIIDSLEIAKNTTLTKPKNEINNIVICGMGGSGIGGKIASQWVQNEINIPVTLVLDYTLPSFVDQHTLLIGSSYSGNTEETIEAVESAITKGAHIIGITSGGKLKEICAANNFDCILVPGGNPPRSAVAFSTIQLMAIFTKLGFISNVSLNEINASYQLLLDEKEDIHAKGKEIASFLYGKVGIIYAEAQYEAIAVRARQQFNENSKYLCWTQTIPEMNHNELVGWGGGDNRFAALFIQTDDVYARNKKRMDITKDVVAGKGATVMALDAKGNSQIQQSIYLINVVDWASFYLSELNKVDIIDIVVIDYLKNELANFN